MQITLSIAEDYRQLEEHISVHRWYLGEERGGEVDYSEAVASWIDNVYLPRLSVIREHAVKQEYPDHTDGDLYLRVAEYRPELVASGSSLP